MNKHKKHPKTVTLQRKIFGSSLIDEAENRRFLEKIAPKTLTKNNMVASQHEICLLLHNKLKYNMTYSKTILALMLATGLLLIMSCGPKKQTTSTETTGDTIPAINTDQPINEIKDQIATPENAVDEKTANPVVKEVGKADLSGKGTIVQKGEIWVIRTTGPEGTDYLPSNLDNAFKVDGKL